MLNALVEVSETFVMQGNFSVKQHHLMEYVIYCIIPITVAHTHAQLEEPPVLYINLLIFVQKTMVT